MNEQRPSKEKVTRWLVVAGGDGYETHICEGVEAMERKFLEVHFGPPLLAPEYTRGEIEEMESLLGHLRNENHWTTDSDLGRVSYSIRHEDGCVDVIRLTDESPSHEPPADPVGFVARSKIDGTIFRDFAKPGECHPVNDQCEWMPVYARAPSPPEPAHSADHLQRFTDWLVKEMPAGTVIGDPAWWARKLLAGACVFADEMPPDADGERYRFLRQPGNAIVYARDPHAWGHNTPGHIRYGTPEQLDAAIDAAIGASVTKSWPLDKQVEAVRKHTTGETGDGHGNV